MKNKLLPFFNVLSKDEQSIMLALAVIYAPIGQSSFAKLLEKSACFDRQTLGLINKPLRDKLQNSRLIIMSTDGWRCNEEIAEPLMRLAVDQPWFGKLTQQIIAEPNYFYSAKINAYHAIKQLRIFLYQGNETAFSANIERFYTDFRKSFTDSINIIFFKHYDAAWFSSLSDQMRFQVLDYLLRDRRIDLIDTSEPYQLMEQFFGQEKPRNPIIVHGLIEERLLRGNIKDAEQWLVGDYSFDALKLLATLRFLENNNDEAIALFEQSLKILKKETGKRNVSIEGIHGFFFNLALLKTRSPQNIVLLKQQTQITLKKSWQNEGFYILNLILLDAVDIYQGKSTSEQSEHLLRANKLPYERLFHVLLLYWIGEIDNITKHPRNKDFLADLASFCLQAKDLGYEWYAAVSALLLQRLNYKNQACEKLAQQYSQSTFKDIIDLLPQVSAWQRALDALTQLTVESDVTVQTELRLIWSLSLLNNAVILEPKEQRLGKNGRWTKGRPIALKRLHQDIADFDYLTEQDRRICKSIQVEKEDSYYGYSSKEYYALPSIAIVEAAGHPHVYWLNQEATSPPVDIVLAEPQLLVK